MKGALGGRRLGGAARKHKDEQHAESARSSKTKEDLLHDSKEKKASGTEGEAGERKEREEKASVAPSRAQLPPPRDHENEAHLEALPFQLAKLPLL